VRASRDEDAQHAAVLLGDALHTASLPLADDGRLVIIRHLPLGRICVGVSAASLALHVERVARDLIGRAVTCDQPAAAGANAIVFRNPAGAVIAAARILGGGEPADEWFWPRVIPGWSDTPRASRWPLLIDAAHRLPGSPVIASAVVHEAVQSADGERFLSTIAPADAVRWLRDAGWHECRPAARDSVSPPVTAFRSAAIAGWRKRWRAADTRLIWLDTMLAIYDNPACAADAGLPARLAASLLDDAPVSHRRAATSVPPAASRPSPQPRPLEPGRPSPSREAAGTADGIVEAGDTFAPTMASAEAPDAPESAVETAPARRPAAQASAPPDRVEAMESLESPGVDVLPPRTAGAATGFGGLMLVVPILERLGFAEFVSADSRLLDAGFPAYLLRSIGRRVGMPLDDPLSHALAQISQGRSVRLQADLASPAKAGHYVRMKIAVVCEPALAFPLRDVEVLPAAAQRILSTPPRRAAMYSAADAWTAAVRRWCRRHARQGLIALIRRPARVHVSRTHIDVDFRLSQADVRIRRLALDVDPGWVPWLGRVVQFSYRDRR
jgi:hypothetical protein